MKEEDIPLVYVSSISAILIYFNLLTLVSSLAFFEIDPLIGNKYWALTAASILWIINYFFFVKPKKFIEYDFKKDRSGGMLVILYIIMTAVSFVLVANYHRTNILGL